jgi:4-carboxymuconolactone decarboxylase
MTESQPRIPRITPEEWTDGVKAMFDVLTGPNFAKNDDNHVLNTFAHYPELTQPFLIFNRHILSTTSLPVRLRQIAILRVAWLRKSRYMWSSHLRTSLRRGFVGEDFEPIKVGADSPYWNEEESLVLRCTDELVTTSDLCDDSWNDLSEYFNRKQMLDFLFTVGCYMLMAIVLNATRIDREQDLKDLADVYGAPT